MKDTQTAISPAPGVPAPRPDQARAWLAAAAALGIVAVVYAPYLVPLFRFAAGSTLYSHIPLVPAVTAWLIWNRRREWSAATYPSRTLAAVFAAVAALLLIAFWLTEARGIAFPLETRLAFTTASAVLAAVAVMTWFLGASFVRAAVFPLSFLVFMIPMPLEWVGYVETVLQHGSAFFARLLFDVAGTPVFYGNLLFQLPGITLRVAPECSGIHSTLALFMVSLLAGHLFLRSTPKAALLTALVFPLALLRNGFRIFVVGELCVTRGPQMIESPIHRQGGPIFFALSLVPFLLALWLLVRSEHRSATSRSTPLAV